MSVRMVFTAYVDGPEMARDVHDRLRQLCDERDVVSDVRVVDVTVEPGAAEECNVVGVPTVVREEPAPRRRVIGVLDDAERVAEALGLHERWDETSDGVSA